MHRYALPLTLAAAALTLTGCGAQQDPAPTATVTVTATPSAESSTPTPEAAETTEAQAMETAPPAEAETPETAPTGAVEAPAAPAETDVAEDESQGVSIVESEGMEGDDYIIRLRTNQGATATENYAPSVMQSRIQSLTGTPQAKNIDLVAMYTADGVMIATGRLPDGKYAGVTSGL